MQKINAIIIDDEPKLCELLQSKLQKNHPAIRVLSLCHSAAQALEKTILLKPDLLFLDIDMPQKNGLEFLTLLREAKMEVMVIITTAYNENKYLHSAIKLAVSGYLLKPILAEELNDAIQKVKEKLLSKKSANDIAALTKIFQPSPTIDFCIATGKLYLKQEQVVYIKAEGNYSRFYLNDGRNELITESLKDLEIKFQHTQLVRADRSHIINKSYIEKITSGTNRCYFSNIANQHYIELSDSGIKFLQTAS